MKQDYNETVEKDDGIFATIVIEYSTKFNWFSEMSSAIRNVLDRRSIEQKDVTNINITIKDEKVEIKLTYTKFDLFAITKGKSEKEQIIAVLGELGYSNEKIRKVEYEKEWPKCDELNNKIWKVEIDEHFDQDETFSQCSYEISMSQKISEALGFRVSVSTY